MASAESGVPLSSSGTPYRGVTPEQLASGVAALLFALAVIFMPWESFGGVHYVDFNVYLETFQPSNDSVREIYAPESIIDVFSLEVVWDEFVRLLVRIIGDPFLALKVISGFVLWLNAYLLYRRYGYLLPTLMLLNPLFLDFALSQLRLSFAMAVLLLALNIRARMLQWALVLAAVFMHSAVPIFIGMFLVVKCVERYGEEWPLHRILALAGAACLVVVVLLAFGRDALLLAMGDRRAFTYADSYGRASIMYVAFWAGVLFMQLVAGRDYLRRPDNLYAAMNLFLFIGLTAAGTYGSRFVAAAFPLVAASVLNLPAENRSVVLPMYFVFQAIQFLYWFAIVY